MIQAVTRNAKAATARPSNNPAETNYPLGVGLALLAALSLSTGGLLLRAIEGASGWQILTYRSAAFVLLLLTIILIQNRGRLFAPFLAIGWSGLFVAIALGIGFLAYVFAILNTTVANAMFVLASAPVLAAIISRIVIGERLRPFVWGLIALTTLGIALMVASDLSLDRLKGNIFALIASCTFAISIVLIRKEGHRDMLPATCLGGMIAFAVALMLSGSLLISKHDIAISLALGLVQVGVGFICYTYAPRFILAAEVALIGQLEPVLAPLWVWLAFDEKPSTATLYGGTLVMVAIIAFAVTSLRDQRRTRRMRAGL